MERKGSEGRSGEGGGMVGEARLLRSVMGHFATGVTLVTARGEGGEPMGLTANSLTSISLHPPLVLVSLDLRSTTLRAIRGGGGFGISILRVEDEPLAHRFARDEPEARFQGIELRDDVAANAPPLLRSALAWLLCTVREEIEAGDHVILLGEVSSMGRGPEGEPLLFHRGGYHTLGPGSG